MTVFTWSTTSASNNSADSTINWSEGQSPGSVNNSARAMMAAIAKWRDDQSGNLVTGGTSTAYTLTTNQSFTALTDGITVYARMSATNGADPTLAVDGLTAKNIDTDNAGTAVATGALISGQVFKFTYDSSADAWIVNHGAGAVLPVVAGGTGAITAAAALTNLGITIPSSGDWWDHYAYVSSSGVTEIGGSLDFHEADAGVTDYDYRLTSSSSVLSGSGSLSITGDITASGNVTAYSDARIKTDVKTIERATELVESMRGVSYRRTDTGDFGVGVIAQEMREVLPEVVHESPGGEYLSVAYGNLVGVLIEAVKELSARVRDLETQQ